MIDAQDRSKFSLESVRSSICILCDSVPDLSTYGILPEDFNKLSSTSPWLAPDRPVVQKTLEAFVFGVMDAQNIPRFNPPAEYIAGVILLTVNPINYLACCVYMSGYRPAEVLGDVSNEIDEVITPSQLHSNLVMFRASSDLPSFRNKFRRKIISAKEIVSELPPNAQK